MAYARLIGKSNVYVWGSFTKLHCSACRITPLDQWYDEWTTTSRSAMLKHLYKHRAVRSKVPASAIRRLKREIRQVGDEY